MQRKLLIVVTVFAAKLMVNADVNMPASSFKRSSGGSFVNAGLAGAKWVHKFDNGGEISKGDCPKTISSAEEEATFSGAAGTYEIRAGLLAKNNKPGGAQWWIKVNGSKVAGGTCLTAKSCAGKDVCSSKSLCANEIQEISAVKSISLKSGDKITFGGNTSWPCGCDGVRGGYYSGYGYIKFVGGGGGGGGGDPVTEFVSPTSTSLDAKKQYSLVAKGASVVWTYKVGTGAAVAIGSGLTVNFTPDASLATKTIVITATGANGKAERNFKINSTTSLFQNRENRMSMEHKKSVLYFEVPEQGNFERKIVDSKGNVVRYTK